MNPLYIRNERLKKLYPVGTRVRIRSLANPEPDLPVGMEGTVIGYDDQPALLMKWDNGSSLSILPYEGDWVDKVYDENGESVIDNTVRK